MQPAYYEDFKEIKNIGWFLKKLI